MGEDNPLLARDILRVPERQIQKFNALGVLSITAVSFLSTGIKTRDTSYVKDSSSPPYNKVQYYRQMQAVEQNQMYSTTAKFGR